MIDRLRPPVDPIADLEARIRRDQLARGITPEVALASWSAGPAPKVNGQVRPEAPEKPPATIRRYRWV